MGNEREDWKCKERDGKPKTSGTCHVNGNEVGNGEPKSLVMNP